MTSLTEDDKEVEHQKSEERALEKASGDVVILPDKVKIDKSLSEVTSELKIKELPYRIEELPDRWGKSIEDILRMVLGGKMKWWVLKPVVFFTKQPIKERYEIIESGVAETFLTRKDTYMEYFHGIGEPCRYYLKDFVVFSGEIAQVEALHPELCGLSIDIGTRTTDEIPKNHIDTIRELEAASGWSINTLKKKAKTHGIPCEINEETGKLTMVANDILRLKALCKKKYRK